MHDATGGGYQSSGMSGSMPTSRWLASGTCASRRGDLSALVNGNRDRRHDGGAFEGDWLDIDTNNYDLDPVHYLEEVADAFGIQLPPYSDNRKLVEYVLARWVPAAS